MDLARCKKCGGMGAICEEERPEYRLVYHGECCECGAKTMDTDTEEQARNDWNSLNRKEDGDGDA